VLKRVLNLFAVLPSLLQPLTLLALPVLALPLLALPLLQLAFAPAASPQALFVLHRPSAIHLKVNQRSESK
jgi:hypothetical protein